LQNYKPERRSMGQCFRGKMYIPVQLKALLAGLGYAG